MKEKMVPGLPPWPLYKGSAMRWPPVLKHSTINQGGLRSPPPHQYQSPPPTWRQQRDSLPKPLTPAEGNSDLPGLRLTHLGCEDMRSESLETAHHSEVVEAEEAAASKGQVEHVES